MWRSRSSADEPLPEITLGFGGNLGEPARTIGAALRRLGEDGVTILARSRLYRTQPWGPVAQPDFLNGCALARTDLGPRDLLALTQRVEAEFGREREVRWGPRTLDIDILTYGDVAIDEPGLTIPHPRMTERTFVLVPLTEIAPDRIVSGRAVRDWAATTDRSGVTPVEPSGQDEYFTVQP